MTVSRLADERDLGVAGLGQAFLAVRHPTRVTQKLAKFGTTEQKEKYLALLNAEIASLFHDRTSGWR